jgi:hypothetical protein
MQAMPDIKDAQDDNQGNAQADQAQQEPSQLPTAVRMTRLAESFRSLEYKPGVRPWNAVALANWVRSHDGDATPAQAQAAAFVLEVASMSTVWDGVPDFRVHEAVAIWSKEDRAAFAAWAKNPWFA